MISPLLQFRSRLTPTEKCLLDHARLLTSVVRGYAGTLLIPPSSTSIKTNTSRGPPTLTVISRLSSRRAGTRFNSRGIDDDGNVANFVETETVFWSPTGICFSYIQIRGSMPVFWESTSSLIPGQQKITITRSPEATQPAFDRHFENLEQAYGGVHIVNLLSAFKQGEAELTDRYRYHIERSPLRHGKEESDEGVPSEHSLLRDTEFDFHERTKGPGGYEGARALRPYIESSGESFAYFLSDEGPKMTAEKSPQRLSQLVVVMQQSGVFRVNCLDCLDRTNLVQTQISQLALELFFGHKSELASQDFWMRHSSLWADNGDALSHIYAGTGALKSSYTRHGKMSLAGAFADARKSATRLYVNNFADKKTQNTIDLLLGRLLGQTAVELYDPLNDWVNAELMRKAAEFTSSKSISIRVATFNLNGKTAGLQEDLSPWLYPKSSTLATAPEVVAVGFQEIVELNPQQIMQTDPAHKSYWEEAVKNCLNSDPTLEEDSYVLLRSGQLVGAALMIFVKTSFLPLVKHVEGGIKKTGLSGIAGNKGAVAIRMDLASTSVCFVTAHLAAGFANYEERNKDYRTISSGLSFSKGRGIDDHDTIIWFGDFNYRIGLGHEKARQLVAANDLETLYANDQLNLQMVAATAFPFYSEARVKFLPTYKFDLGTDTYDASEKNRIPAWTDRCLYKASNLKLLEYNSAPLRFSDHRPVYASFDCQIRLVQEEKRAQLSQRLYDKRKEDVSKRRGAVDGSGSGADSDDDDLMGYNSISPNLPPASSERRKWWLDGDKAARSNIGPLKEGMILNGRRPGNPWRETDEPDWVDVRKPGSVERSRSRDTKPEGERKMGTPKPEPLPPRRTMIVPRWDGQSSDSNSTPPSIAGRASPALTPSASLARGKERSESTTSDPSSALSTKKAPPVKPQKPAMLSSTPSSGAVPQTTAKPAAASIIPQPRATDPTPAASKDVQSRFRSDSKPPLPSRSNTASSTSSFASVSRPTETTSKLQRNLQPPTQPRRGGATLPPNSNRGADASASDEPPAPALPPRRAPTNQGLMDEDSEGSMKTWKPLQPG